MQKGSFLTKLLVTLTLNQIISQFELHQLINEPTHVLQNSSCIYLIFISQPNVIVESGVHPSIHPNCHHQVVFVKFNLKICYPPLYLGEVGSLKKRMLILSKEQLTISTGRKFLHQC